MNKSTTRWLFLMALVVGAAIYFLDRRPGGTGRGEGQPFLLPGLRVRDVTAVELLRSTNISVRLERVQDQWQFVAPIRYPASSGGIESLVEALAALKETSRLSAGDVLRQTNGVAAFGFAPPPLTVVVWKGAERVEVRFGGATLLGREVYSQVVGQDGLRTVDSSFARTLPPGFSEWRDMALAQMEGLEFDRVEMRPLTNGFEVVRNQTNRTWQMTRPLLTRANAQRLEYLFQQLQLARVVAFVTDDPGADLEPYGLRAPARELVFSRGTNQVLAIQFGGASTNSPELIYARRMAHSNVVLVARQVVEPWLANFREFCDRRLMAFDAGGVARIEVQGEEAFALERGTNQLWRVVEPVAMDADIGLVGAFLDTLASLEFVEFEKEVVGDFGVYGLAPPKRSYVLRASPVKGSTNLLGPVVSRVDYGLPNGPTVFARRSLESSVVKTFDNGRLARRAFQLRDRRVWQFTTNQVAGLSIRQEGRTRNLVRTGPMQWTHAAGSQGIINPFTLEEAVYRLGQLRAESWVARGTAQFGYYGISAVDHQIEALLNGGEAGRKYVLRLGRKAPSGRYYGAVDVPEVPEPVIMELPQSLGDYIESDLSAPAPPGGGGQ